MCSVDTDTLAYELSRNRDEEYGNSIITSIQNTGQPKKVIHYQVSSLNHINTVIKAKAN